MGSVGPPGFLAGALRIQEAEKRASPSSGCFGLTFEGSSCLPTLFFIRQWRKRGRACPRESCRCGFESWFGHRTLGKSLDLNFQTFCVFCKVG